MTIVLEEEMKKEADEDARICREIWGFEGRRTKDKYRRDIILENKILLRRCKTVKEIHSTKNWYPRIQVKVAGVHGKYAYGVDIIGKTGGFWGNGYHPSLHKVPYDSCEDALLAGLTEAHNNLKRRLESKSDYYPVHAEDSKLLRLVEEALGPQQLDLF